MQGTIGITKKHVLGPLSFIRFESRLGAGLWLKFIMLASWEVEIWRISLGKKFTRPHFNQ
jgi:hypothetical protein